MNIPFDSFETFLDWFARVVLPWLMTGVASGGLATIIYKVAKVAGNTSGLKQIQKAEKEELDELRIKYKTTIDALSARDELLKLMIDTTINQQKKEKLLAAYSSLPKLEELQSPTVMVKVKKKKKKKKKAQDLGSEVNADGNQDNTGQD